MISLSFKTDDIREKSPEGSLFDQTAVHIPAPWQLNPVGVRWTWAIAICQHVSFSTCRKIAQSLASCVYGIVYTFACVYMYACMYVYERSVFTYVPWVRSAVYVSAYLLFVCVYLYACLHMSAKWEVADPSYIYDTISV